jgi:UDP-2,4-diacetamido-2,4,6-trideoxy-beta-L-altropyranose hydrolase
MRLAIRADASGKIGSGHVMRCLALAEANRKADGETVFVMQNLPGHLAATVRDHGHLALVVESSTDTEPGSADWQLQDASATRRVLESWGDVDALVVDHYQLRYAWEVEFQDVAALMGMAGVDPRAYRLNVLHDQTYRGVHQQVWRGLLQKDCELLLGPRYALLRDEFQAKRSSVNAISDQVRSVVVTLGGSAPEKLTRQVACAVCEVLPKRAEVHVILNAEAAREDPAVGSGPADPANMCFHYGVRGMAEFMGGADIAVTAGGVSALEALCLGRPLLVVPWVENQRAATEHLLSDGYCLFGGDGTAFDAEAFGQTLLRLAESPQERSRMSELGMQLVDGRGASRALERLSRRLA